MHLVRRKRRAEAAIAGTTANEAITNTVADPVILETKRPNPSAGKGITIHVISVRLRVLS
jgi:hypothetical protein